MEKWAECDYPESFDALAPERQQRLLDWIADNLIPIKGFNSRHTGFNSRHTGFNSRHTSYGLKHCVKFEDDADAYFTNGEFKGAMLKAGYIVQDRSALNWVFNVSQRSPAFSRK